MALVTGPKLPIFTSGALGDLYLAQGNAMLRLLQALIEANVLDTTLTAPPGAPANGDTYVVAPGATGLWATHDNAVAYWTTNNPGFPAGHWEFFTPKIGWLVGSANGSFYRFTGSAWVVFGSGTSPRPLGRQSYYTPAIAAQSTTALVSSTSLVRSSPTQASHKLITNNSIANGAGNCILSAELPPFAVSTGFQGTAVTTHYAISYGLFRDFQTNLWIPSLAAKRYWLGLVPRWALCNGTLLQNGPLQEDDPGAATTVLTLTSTSNPTNNVVTPNGTIVNGGGDTYVGETAVIAGFVNAVNNGSFPVVEGGTVNILALTNPAGVAETHAATATFKRRMVAFRLSDSAGDTHWKAYATDGNGPGTVVDTGVAPDFVNGHTFEIQQNAAGVFTFLIDGVIVATITMAGLDAFYPSLGFSTDNLNNGTGSPVSIGWGYSYAELNV